MNAQSAPRPTVQFRRLRSLWTHRVATAWGLGVTLAAGQFVWQLVGTRGLPWLAFGAVWAATCWRSPRGATGVASVWPGAALAAAILVLTSLTGNSQVALPLSAGIVAAVAVLGVTIVNALTECAVVEDCLPVLGADFASASSPIPAPPSFRSFVIDHTKAEGPLELDVDDDPDVANENEQGRLVQTWERRRLEDAETIAVRCAIEFPARTRNIAVHLPFIPPFSAIPNLYCECDSESCQVTVDRVWSYGVRLQLRRTGALDQSLDAWLDVAMEAPIGCVAAPASWRSAS